MNCFLIIQKSGCINLYIVYAENREIALEKCIGQCFAYNDYIVTEFTDIGVSRLLKSKIIDESQIIK